MARSTRSPFSTTETPAVSLAFEGLSKNFGELAVLRDITFAVEAGEIFVLMGPSGCGKSVLLKHIVGLEMPTAGRVLVDGKDATDPATREDVRMALVFQAGALFNSLSVYDNLAFFPREHRTATEAVIREKVMRALQILSLEHAVDKFPSDLSGGMAKRVAIARALVMEPQLMLYDEPTSGLDPVMSTTISEIIATLKDEYHVTTFVVSHDRELALNIGHRVAILMDGKLLTIATPAELREPTDPRVADFLAPRYDLKNPRFKHLET
ncbi:MAG: ATP-binding cassette domain-containing protein [Opitutaceae bacterium]|nr:ATP-binding cassette domain-containing protein [Opitutaceae bacterium]